MCGIVGTLGFRNDDASRSMLTALKHRGPDDSGEYADPERNVYLGHRRLSIIDTSSAGHQPMSDTDENIWVVYNGEIYNYKLLVEDLTRKGYVFKSSSDTEVLIHGYKEYGTDIFEKIDGMWALALYDRNAAKLILSRDPAGIKPLYIYQNGDELMFASEIAALREALPGNGSEIDTSAIARYLAHGYIYGEQTAYQRIQSLPRASCMTIDLASSKTSTTSNYLLKKMPPPKDLNDAVHKFDAIFKASVANSLQADVPVGIFLSGGIDSSLVAYYARENGASLQTFTIGFEEKDFDESQIASRIAKQFGFPSTIAMMSGNDVANDIEKILDAFGQPFADMSAIPTYFLSKLAHENGYKVVLTGDGADELFGGYPTHYLPALTRWYQKTPRVLDSILEHAADALPIKSEKLGTKEKLQRFLSGARESPERAHAIWKRVFGTAELKQLLRPEFYDIVIKTDITFDTYRDTTLPIEEAVARMDFETFLTWDCLVKSDISAMRNAIEGRVPFLNKPVMDFAWSLPANMKVRPFQTKILLRKVLEEKGGHEFSRLPKQGFVPPLSRWLCQELKSAMLNVLSSENLEKVGFLEKKYVQALITEHLDMRKNNAKKIWSLMSLVRFYSHSHYL